jgi:hypothetical protein
VVVFVRLPELPVMVTGAVPMVAVALAVSVSTLEATAGFALNVAVTPLGRPDADKVTPPLKPPSAVTAIVLVPLFPCLMLRLLGDPERVKLPTEFTVSAIVVVFVRLPEVPVMVTVVVPIAAAPLAVRVNMLAVLAGFGLNEAVTPFGKPEADKVTFPLNPFRELTVIVLMPLALCVIIKLLGDAERLKFGVDAGQLFAKLAALTLPIPVAKSQPVVVPYAVL